MKKIGMRIGILALAASLTLSCGGMAAMAAIPEVESQDSQTTIQPRADVIVWKFRYYNGNYERRRWNQTWGCWVDPEWIPNVVN